MSKVLQKTKKNIKHKTCFICRRSLLNTQQHHGTDKVRYSWKYGHFVINPSSLPQYLSNSELLYRGDLNWELKRCTECVSDSWRSSGPSRRVCWLYIALQSSATHRPSLRPDDDSRYQLITLRQAPVPNTALLMEINASNYSHQNQIALEMKKLDLLQRCPDSIGSCLGMGSGNRSVDWGYFPHY